VPFCALAVRGDEVAAGQVDSDGGNAEDGRTAKADLGALRSHTKQGARSGTGKERVDPVPLVAHGLEGALGARVYSTDGGFKTG